VVAFAGNSDQWGSLPSLWARFEEMLPKIQHCARDAFPNVGPKRREELVTEVTNYAFRLYTHLAKLQTTDIAYAEPLAILAIKHVLAGWPLTGSGRCQADHDRLRR